MRLCHSDYDIMIEMVDGNVSVLVVENPILFRLFAFELRSQMKGNDGPFILSHDLIEDVSIKDNLDCIFSPFDLLDVPKRVTSRIQTEFASFLTDAENSSRTGEILSSIESYAMDMFEAFSYDVEGDELSASALAKFLSPSLRLDFDSPAEMVLEHMNMMHNILGIGDFVFFNFMSFFSTEELDCLCDACQLEKHNILFIENTKRVLPSSCTNFVIIDEDGCIIS